MVSPRDFLDGDQTPGPREQSTLNFSSHGERERGLVRAQSVFYVLARFGSALLFRGR